MGEVEEYIYCSPFYNHTGKDNGLCSIQPGLGIVLGQNKDHQVVIYSNNLCLGLYCYSKI